MIPRIIRGNPALAMTAKKGAYIFTTPPLAPKCAYDVADAHRARLIASHSLSDFSHNAYENHRNDSAEEVKEDNAASPIRMTPVKNISSDLLYKKNPSDLEVIGCVDESLPILARQCYINGKEVPGVYEVAVPKRKTIRFNGRELLQQRSEMVITGYMYKEDVENVNQFGETYIPIASKDLFSHENHGSEFKQEEKLDDIFAQSQFNNCFFVAALGALLREKGLDYFRERIKDNGNGTSTVRLHDITSDPGPDGIYPVVDVIVDNARLSRQTDYDVTHGRHHKMPWIHLMENAYVSLGIRAKKNADGGYSNNVFRAFPSFEDNFPLYGQPVRLAFSVITGQKTKNQKVLNYSAIKNLIIKIKKNIEEKIEDDTVNNDLVRLFERLTGLENNKTGEKIGVSVVVENGSSIFLDKNMQSIMMKNLLKRIDEKDFDNFENLCKKLNEVLEDQVKKISSSNKTENADHKKLKQIENEKNLMESIVKRISSRFDTCRIDLTNRLREHSKNPDICIVHATHHKFAGQEVEIAKRYKIEKSHCYSHVGMGETPDGQDTVILLDPLGKKIEVPMKAYMECFDGYSYVESKAPVFQQDHDRSASLMDSENHELESKEDIMAPVRNVLSEECSYISSQLLDLLNKCETIKVSMERNDPKKYQKHISYVNELISILNEQFVSGSDQEPLLLINIYQYKAREFGRLISSDQAKDLLKNEASWVFWSCFFDEDNGKRDLRDLVEGSHKICRDIDSHVQKCLSLLKTSTSPGPASP